MTTTNTPTISPVDALWALYMSQSKANKKKFRSLLAAEDRTEQEKKSAKTIIATSTAAPKVFNDDEYISLKSHEDIDRYFDSM